VIGLMLSKWRWEAPKESAASSPAAIGTSAVK
jgi:hypothetical protein